MYVLFMARRWGMSARLGQYIESLISDSFLRELKEDLEWASASLWTSLQYTEHSRGEIALKRSTLAAKERTKGDENRRARMIS